MSLRDQSIALQEMSTISLKDKLEVYLEGSRTILQNLSSEDLLEDIRRTLKIEL